MTQATRLHTLFLILRNAISRNDWEEAEAIGRDIQAILREVEV